ncbi:hypothetical protein E4U55_008089 [Claviceps digitariae]|nr:hypothetical protein E4U55_008089 [Claviceps digitariae]
MSPPLPRWRSTVQSGWCQRVATHQPWQDRGEDEKDEQEEEDEGGARSTKHKVRSTKHKKCEEKHKVLSRHVPTSNTMHSHHDTHLGWGVSKRNLSR